MDLISQRTLSHIGPHPKLDLVSRGRIIDLAKSRQCLNERASGGLIPVNLHDHQASWFLQAPPVTAVPTRLRSLISVTLGTILVRESPHSLIPRSLHDHGINFIPTRRGKKMLQQFYECQVANILTLKNLETRTFGKAIFCYTGVLLQQLMIMDT